MNSLLEYSSQVAFHTPEFPPEDVCAPEQENARPRTLPGEPTDELLMERIKLRDEAALAALDRRHHGLIRTIIRRTTNNDSDADSLAYECLLEVWRHASSYCPERGGALGWIVTLVRRRAIDRVRRRTAYSRAQDRCREDCKTFPMVSQAEPCEDAERNDTAKILGEFISHLPEAQQEVVRLAFYHDLSQRDIAHQTGIPLGTIKTRLELALRKLRSKVLAYGELSDPSRAARPPSACGTRCTRSALLYQGDS